MIEIYKPGQSVKIKSSGMNGITGIINAIQINYNNMVLYQIIWWNGRTRCSEWLPSQEIELENFNNCSIKIGFYS